MAAAGYLLVWQDCGQCLGRYGSCLVPRCMGLPLGPCSEDLGEKISSRSAVGSIDSEAVIRCIYGVCVCVCVCVRACVCVCSVMSNSLQPHKL